MLEANPAVTTYCERPVLASNQHDAHADFWLLQDGRPQYLALNHAIESAPREDSSAAGIPLLAFHSNHSACRSLNQNLAIEGIGLLAKWDDFTSIIRQRVDK